MTSVQRARHELRRAILAGEMAPGQRLVEGKLARLFGVTRASMRSALTDLIRDELVERIPHHSARVRVITRAEAADITECRMVLEGLCAARAAERVTEEQAGRLRELREELISSAGGPAANDELYRLIREFSGQDIAIRLLDRLDTRLARSQTHVSVPESLAVIDAILAGDPAAAEQAASRRFSRSAACSAACTAAEQDSS